MTRTEVIRKLEEALNAIQEYKREGLDRATYNFERDEIQKVQETSRKLLIEAKTIGAAGQTCPVCNGSGRV
jgi:DNA repair exonuclease SbcCD ATPase subunit